MSRANVKNVDIYGRYFPGVNSVKLLYLESSVYGLFVSVCNCVRDTKQKTKNKKKLWAMKRAPPRSRVGAA